MSYELEGQRKTVTLTFTFQVKDAPDLSTTSSGQFTFRPDTVVVTMYNGDVIRTTLGGYRLKKSGALTDMRHSIPTFRAGLIRSNSAWLQEILTAARKLWDEAQ
jgi:hypothetical protein